MRKFLLLLAIGGCGVDVPAISPDGDAAFNAMAVRAAQEWTDVGCAIDVVDGFERGTEVVHVSFDAWSFGNASGMFVDDTIYVRADGMEHRILLHEMGHMLGFPHRDHGIMEPTVNVDYVTAEDCE